MISLLVLMQLSVGIVYKPTRWRTADLYEKKTYPLRLGFRLFHMCKSF